MASGILKLWRPERGYGFVLPDDGGPDVFLHITALQLAGIDSSTLRIGERLLFSVDATTRPGKIQACKVRRPG